MPRWKALYAKGSSAERELIQILESNGFMTARIAGSGKNLNPDVLAFKEGLQYAFECKNWDADSLWLEKTQWQCLLEWTKISGITTYVAWRKGKNNWFIIHPKEMEQSDKGCSITLKKAMLIGRRIADII